jgi:hypothetical protein
MSSRLVRRRNGRLDQAYETGAPATEKRTVAPQRPPNADLRTREHLTADGPLVFQAASRDRLDQSRRS